MRYNFAKRLRKYRITRYYLWKYLKDWRKLPGTRNFFYYATLNELKTLNYIINYIKGKFNELRLAREDYNYLKDIGNAKDITFGDFYYKF